MNQARKRLALSYEARDIPVWYGSETLPPSRKGTPMNIVKERGKETGLGVFLHEDELYHLTHVPSGYLLTRTPSRWEMSRTVGMYLRYGIDWTQPHERLVADLGYWGWSRSLWNIYSLTPDDFRTAHDRKLVRIDPRPCERETCSHTASWCFTGQTKPIALCASCYREQDRNAQASFERWEQGEET